MAPIENAQIGQFELEIELNAPPERVWRAMTEEIDRWWLPDFRAAGETSVMSLDLRPGGALLESSPNGNELVWFNVQMVRPGSTLYLVGHTAPDWGGPNISMLKLALTPRAEGSLLTVSDSIVGRLSENQLDGIGNGWQTLFGSGLRAHLARPQK